MYLFFKINMQVCLSSHIWLYRNMKFNIKLYEREYILYDILAVIGYGFKSNWEQTLTFQKDNDYKNCVIQNEKGKNGDSSIQRLKSNCNGHHRIKI